MNDPLPLKDLPGYLKNHQDENLVVDMGKIVSPKKTSFNLKFVLTICLIFGLAGSMIFSGLSNKDVVVVINAGDNDIQRVANIIKEGGDQIISLKQNNDKTYEVKIKTRKNTINLLDNLRKKIEFKDVELN